MVGNALRRWTMRSVSLGILLCLFGFKCAPSASRPTKNDCTDMPTVPEGEKAVFMAACDSMITIDATMKCPDFFDDPVPAVPPKIVWDGEPLLPGAKGDLGKYCRYTWVDPTRNPDASLLKSSIKVDDCTFITPQSWPDSFDQWAHNEFVQSVSGERAPAMTTDGLRTRVIVFDTSPDESEAIDIEPGLTSNHGETLATMIKELACGDNGTICPIQVKTQLVMPWYLDEGIPKSTAGGGNIGRLSDVARAMWWEMEAFRQELQNAADALIMDPANKEVVHDVPTRLVLNESFAFGGDQCDFDPTKMAEDARALFETFTAAACLGAAHVAAAGNHSGGPLPNGSLLLCPARWDHGIVPTLEMCETLFGAAEYTAITTNFRAVTKVKYGMEQDLLDPSWANTDALMSVGAVDFAGLPIVLTRSNACPEAVALGVSGVGWSDSATQSQDYLFGTSVSAAVVSARIAAKWSQDNQQVFYAPDIIRALVNDSYKLRYSTGGACEHLASDICFNTPWIGSAPLGSLSLGGPQNAPLPELASHDLILRNDTIDELLEYTFQEYANDHAPVCTARIPQCVKENAAAAAASASTNTGVIWPQPTDPVCLRCGITFRGNGWVELWLDPNYRFALTGTSRTVIKSAALVISNALGKVEFTIPLDPSVIVTPSVTKITVPVTDLTGRRAWISAYDDKGNSFSQQIFVNP